MHSRLQLFSRASLRGFSGWRFLQRVGATRGDVLSCFKSVSLNNHPRHRQQYWNWSLRLNSDDRYFAHTELGKRQSRVYSTNFLLPLGTVWASSWTAFSRLAQPGDYQTMTLKWLIMSNIVVFPSKLVSIVKMDMHWRTCIKHIGRGGGLGKKQDSTGNTTRLKPCPARKGRGPLPSR